MLRPSGGEKCGLAAPGAGHRKQTQQRGNGAAPSRFTPPGTRKCGPAQYQSRILNKYNSCVFSRCPQETRGRPKPACYHEKELSAMNYFPDRDTPASSPWPKRVREKMGTATDFRSLKGLVFNSSSWGNPLAVPFFRVVGLAPRAASDPGLAGPQKARNPLKNLQILSLQNLTPCR